MNKCNVCQKPSNSQCARCHWVYYCSKECQKEDWKKHKKSCGNSPVVKTNETIDRTEVAMPNLPTDSSPSVNWDVPDFGREYAMKYPHEKKQIQLLESAKSSLKRHQMVENFIDSDFANKPDPGYLMKRWGELSRPLLNFLASPRQIGDIFTRKTKSSYVGDKGMGALSFSNTPKQGLVLDQGKVHVAVGFVDLDLLLRAKIVQTENSVKQPNKFIGYDGSVYAIAKTNVIKEMMMGKAPIRSIIEVWFSTTWTMETLKHFENAVKNVLKFGNAPNDSPPNPTKKELHPKVRSLISHWSESVKSPKSRQEAHRLWAKTFDSEDNVFCVVAARYILTGEFPLMDDQQPKNLIASITMFNCNNGISPHSTSEFMLEMLPMDSILPKYQREDTTFLNAIYNFLEESITEVCAWLSPPAGKSEKIEIYLHFQSVTNDNSTLLASIRQLDPWTMSWSNICDYFHAHDFHKLLRACSGNDTVHAMTSVNWITEVFGAHINEYDSRSRRETLIISQEMITKTGEFMDPSGYFRYTKVITHPYNLCNIGAAINVMDNWQGHFFRGQDLSIGEVSFVPYAQTYKTHTFLNISFTYNKGIKVKTALF
ncbi:6128_t:CDS:1 [Ambispora gerdemannii]|uniref:6128_t:CDS:1 n=1 Tax=Ambispora gerdemannii TaxID=144530 RepID=A0A9N8YQF6_9GLOM|nr:6128_t:CDS:1 [Ambispora gerdemannii]